MSKSTKPSWLKVRFHSGPVFDRVNSVVRKLELNTVCESADCPNKGECWGRLGTATFMIMGNDCTRNCMFCSVGHGSPAPLDAEEPCRVAKAVKTLDLRYAVITSVSRDDLSDGGADHFARTVQAIKELCPGVQTEVLVPDFKGSVESIDRVFESRPYVFAHNIETVERLTKKLRSGAEYERSLKVLSMAAQKIPSWRVKSSIIIGLGETGKEIERTFKDLYKAGVQILHAGQYLQPSRQNHPVEKCASCSKLVPCSGDGQLIKNYSGLKESPLRRIPAATPTFRESTFLLIGIYIEVSAVFLISC
jgi:lipoic acid synthetase